MVHVRSFPPLENPAARILILGSMPGTASLRANQYYAHPQNLFWKFLGEILGFDAKSDYAARMARLHGAGIALWDVLEACVREGSLDADIEHASIVPNDFAGFLETHRHLRRICFNGAKAHELFVRHVQPHIALDEGIELRRLPSTSPANASIPLADKLQTWRAGLLAPL